MVFNRDFDVYFSHAISPTPKVSLSVITIKTQQRFHFSSFMICVLPEYITHADKRGAFTVSTAWRSTAQAGEEFNKQTGRERTSMCVYVVCYWSPKDGNKAVTHRKLYIQRFDVRDMDLSGDTPDAQLINACRFFCSGTRRHSCDKRKKASIVTAVMCCDFLLQGEDTTIWIIREGVTSVCTAPSPWPHLVFFGMNHTEKRGKLIV